MQRLIFILPLLLLFYSCNQKSTNHEKYVTMITSRFVDLDSETFADVKCTDFEEYFSNFQTKVIKDSITINQIITYLNDANTAGKDYYQNVDARIKLELKYNNDSIETICMGRFIFKRNNQLFINSDSLKYLLTSTE